MSDKKVYFMFGLPGAGKSHWIDSVRTDRTVPVLSADHIKKYHRDYNEKEQSSEIHEWSVKEAEELAYGLMTENCQEFYFDGGGINNKYNKRIMSRARDEGYLVTLVAIHTPLSICLERNQFRDRQVPEAAIIDKATRFLRCYENLKEISHKVIDVPYYTNKHIFFDMDGTLAAYQHLPLDTNGNINFTDGEFFRYAKPVRPILDRAATYSNIYILSAMPNNLCLQEKQDWLDKYASFIPKENRFFVGNKRYKNVEILNLAKKMKLHKKDITVVDDDHAVLQSLNQCGINGIHVSEFLTW